MVSWRWDPGIGDRGCLDLIEYHGKDRGEESGFRDLDYDFAHHQDEIDGIYRYGVGLYNYENRWSLQCGMEIRDLKWL
ncbi:hypothetical protein DY000_02005730 [Brassica cretica]|uniref:Neprosin domain-containing protein n=1 Tax=Brassica cretica TaxID=69181 RepID=A0ABQ7C9L5_BRACR|nr:hypothetical protein DY000_02005730 [Brassica cretica]